MYHLTIEILGSFMVVSQGLPVVFYSANSSKPMGTILLKMHRGAHLLSSYFSESHCIPAALKLLAAKPLSQLFMVHNQDCLPILHHYSSFSPNSEDWHFKSHTWSLSHSKSQGTPHESWTYSVGDRIELRAT